MGSVKKLAEEVRLGMHQALPYLRKTVLKKLSLAVAAMIEAQTPNTIELAGLLPLDTDRSDMREQWLRRLLKNPLVECAKIMEPFARAVLADAATGGQTILLSMDQTDLADRFAILMISLRVGDRSLPLTWCVEAGATNIGFSGQKALLEQVRDWLPTGAPVLLLADRFYPGAELFQWLHQSGWQYRLRLKGNLSVDVGHGDFSTTGELAVGVSERYEPEARLFAAGIPTAIGILHEAGHAEPWIIAMDCRPNRAAVLDYGARWAIEPMFSDFKTRGFRLEDTQLEAPDRLARLMLIMALAMYWCVSVGRDDALNNPTSTEKKPGRKPIRITGAFAKPIAVPSPGSNAVYASCSDALKAHCLSHFSSCG
jgi:hypothetical protein